MAAIDFPASPADGQVFSATNGVVYKWSATYSSWLAQSPPPVLGGTGDFCANQTSSFPMITGTLTTMLLTQVYSGNSGLWYNTANGRYTPPAGRYCISVGFSVASTIASFIQVNLRKNGVQITQGQDMIPAAGQTAEASASLIVDANGSDWFDMQVACSGAGTFTPYVLLFQAFPLTGMQGPTGGVPGPVVGDFMATNSAQINVGGSIVQVICNNVITGNSGAYYNPSTGRYTPPAGRYYISFTPGVMGSSTAATTAQSYLRKNGVQVATAFQVPGTAGWYGDPEAHGIFDCNGTDYFEIFMGGNQANAAIAANSAVFLAFPTQGMVGPQGPAGPPPPGAGVGDFCATALAGSIGTTATVLIPTVIQSGNSGGYYNVANGRFTPPAGRYLLHATVTANLSTAAGLNVSLRKNGGLIGGGYGGQVIGSATWWGDPANMAIVDANGTDYFDAIGTVGAGVGTINYMQFLATPISGLAGVQGPTGANGSLTADTGTGLDFYGTAATVPAGWYLCDGASKSTTTDANLFAVIGYTYGGSGANFNLPDCRNRVTVGLDPGGATGRLTTAGSGIDGATLGAVGGVQNYALGIAEMPTHFHQVAISNAGVGGSGGGSLAGIGGASNTTNTGSGAAHPNAQPTLVCNKIIKR